MTRGIQGAILIVEESPMVSDLLALRLTRHFANFEVLCTTSLNRAIELAAIFDVKVVLTDLNVTDSNGLGTAVYLRERTGAPVVIHSAMLNEAHVCADAIKLGFEDTFAKGCSTLAEIVDRIASLIGSQASDAQASDARPA